MQSFFVRLSCEKHFLQSSTSVKIFLVSAIFNFLRFSSLDFLSFQVWNFQHFSETVYLRNLHIVESIRLRLKLPPLRHQQPLRISWNLICQKSIIFFVALMAFLIRSFWLRHESFPMFIIFRPIFYGFQITPLDEQCDLFLTVARGWATRSITNSGEISQGHWAKEEEEDFYWVDKDFITSRLATHWRH